MKRFNYDNPDDSHIFEERYDGEPVHCNHCGNEIKEPNRQDPANKMFICEDCYIIMNYELNKFNK